MSNIAKYLHLEEHVGVEALRFEVQYMASDLCRNYSEIDPQTEKSCYITDIA